MKLTAQKPSEILARVAILLATLVLIEVALALFGIAPDYTGNEAAFTQAPWWVCDDAGCHYTPGAFETNSDGFQDRDEFSTPPAAGILVLGDSFTAGNGADPWQGWVDVMEREAGVEAWNAAVPATGTRQALMTLDYYAPVMRPAVVILGFFPANDLNDNLFPVDQNLWVDEHRALLRYDLDNELNPVPLSEHKVFTRAGRVPPPNTVSAVERAIRHSRLGSLAMHVLDKAKLSLSVLANKQNAEWEQRVIEHQVDVTRDLLAQLQDHANRYEAEFVVVLIPDCADLDGETWEYATTRDLLEELGVSYIDLRPQFDLPDYHCPADPHWNNAGHEKAGQIVAAWLAG